jgi:tRNA A-37 threonylcarbamoyl transferase component Bud32
VDRSSEEEKLAGGNVGTAVVRVGDTVRRPSGPWSRSVDALLHHLNEVGYPAAPRTLGFDDLGRHVLEYVEGEILMPFEPDDHLGAARRVGALIRDLHDASAEFTPPADAQWNVVITPDAEDLVIHHDLAPWNLVLGTERWVFIDWDNAGPGSRLWDLAYAAHGFARLEPHTPATSASRRVAALAEGYRLDRIGRNQLADLLVPRIMSMYDLLREGRDTGAQPWAQLWEEGHGRVWLNHAEYTQRHLSGLREALVHSS